MNKLKAQLTFVFLCVPVALRAQGTSAAPNAKIAVRHLGAVTTASSDTMGVQVNVRALPNGSVLVNDAVRRRVLMYDATLQQHTSVLDSASTSGSQLSALVPSAQVIRYTADSTLYVEVATRSLLVIDPNGKVARVMALPRPGDASILSLAASGAPTIDPKGRLVYRVINQPKIKPPEPGSRVLISMPQQSDAAPIVRADFDLRTVDTIAAMKVFQRAETIQARLASPDHAKDA